MIGIKSLQKLPNGPGVYFFIGTPKRGEGGSKILYVGKATSLRSRVRSYFTDDIVIKRSAAIGKMVSEASKVDYKTTDSVLEALILEAELIKKHQPYYNIREKDDKSFNFVVITKEEFPRVLTVRGKNLLHQRQNFTLAPIRGPRESKNFIFAYAKVYGPFPHGSELREALKIIRRIFPYRDKCRPPTFAKASAGKCFNAQIGLCPGVCSGAISRREYLRYIRNIELFFKGKKLKILREFTKEMKVVAKKHEFEKAAALRNKIFALKHLNDVAMLKRSDLESSKRSDLGSCRVEAYDIAHLSGSSGVGAMAVVVDGEAERGEYRKFKLRGVYAGKVHDVGNLAEVFSRRLTHSEWPKPDVVVVDGSYPQKSAVEGVLKQTDIDIPVVAVVKDEKHRPKNIIGESAIVRDYHHDILLANSEAHRFAKSYHTKLRSKVVE